MSARDLMVPIVVVLYHREEETRMMFEQLARVTDGYSLIIVNNGFDDSDFIRGLNPLHYIENEENTGAIRGINQGLELAEEEYAAVLHNDILIYEEGWLDHIIEFMERREDVGLVGLQGSHTINDDGHFDYESNVAPCRGRCPDSLRPTWRFSEVAMIDGIGWVMRNAGIFLEESYGMMHCYDLDLSLRYISAGFRVYVMPVDFGHLIHGSSGDIELERSSRGRQDYLERIGGDDDRYFDKVTEQFKSIWHEMLPITRGFRDEAYGYLRAEELRRESRALEQELCDEIARQKTEIGRATSYISDLSREAKRQRDEIERLRFLLGNACEPGDGPG